MSTIRRANERGKTHPPWLDSYHTFSLMCSDGCGPRDGVYSPSGQILRSARGSTARFVGSNLAVTTEWQIQRHLTFAAIYEHFFPRAFLRETGPHAAIDFIELTLQFRF